MTHKAAAGSPPNDAHDDTPMDRMMRFGTALFAVKKDELPKRAERKKTPRKKRNPKPEPG